MSYLPWLPEPRPLPQLHSGPQSALSRQDIAPGGRRRSSRSAGTAARSSAGLASSAPVQPASERVRASSQRHRRSPAHRSAFQRLKIGPHSDRSSACRPPYARPGLPTFPTPASSRKLPGGPSLPLSAFTTGSSCGGRERRQRRSGPPPGARAPLLLPVGLLPSCQYCITSRHTDTHTQNRFTHTRRCHCSCHGYQLTLHTQARARSHSHHAGAAPGIPTLLPHPHSTRSPAQLLLAQAAAAAAATTTTTALLCCGATALSVIQGTAQPHPSSPTSAQPSLLSSLLLVHTPSKEEGKHRTEGKAKSAPLTSWSPWSSILILSPQIPLPRKEALRS